MTSRILRAAAAGAAVALALSGCGGSTKDGDGNVTLKLVVADYGTGPQNASKKYWQGIVDAFHAKNPKVSVDITAISWNDFDNQVQTMVQNRQFPDITEGDYFSNYAQDGLLYSADEVLSDPGNLLPVFAKQGTYNGKQYGLPFTTSTRTLFYNKKLFAEAGIAAAPGTWDDVKADASKIKALGKIGFGLPLGPEEAQAEALLWFLGNGGNYQDADGKWAIDSAQNVEAFEFVKDLTGAGLTEPNPGTKNRTDLWKQFAQGEVGMINGSPALIPIISGGGKLTDADWASVPIAGKSGPLASTLGVCDNVAAFNANGHQAQIKAFLDFAYQDEYQVAFGKLYHLLPATTSAANALAGDPVFGPFMTALPNAVQYPNTTTWAEVKSNIQHEIGTAVTDDPKTVLTALQQSAVKAG